MPPLVVSAAEEMGERWGVRVKRASPGAERAGSFGRNLS
jgi:hypothetical protein